MSKYPETLILLNGYDLQREPLLVYSDMFFQSLCSIAESKLEPAADIPAREMCSTSCQSCGLRAQ